VVSGFSVRLVVWNISIHKFVVLQQTAQVIGDPRHSNSCEGEQMIKNLVDHSLSKNELLFFVTFGISEPQFHGSVGGITRWKKKIAKRLRVGLQHECEKMTQKCDVCTQTCIASSVPKFANTHFLVGAARLVVDVHPLISLSRISYTIAVEMFLP
jgi:hypothetical protein